MMALQLCTDCARHIRSSETHCPFCGAASMARAPRSTGIATTRAMQFAVAATLLGCAKESEQKKPEPVAVADAAVDTFVPPDTFAPDTLVTALDMGLDTGVDAVLVDVAPETPARPKVILKAPPPPPPPPNLNKPYGAPPADGLLT